MIPAIKQSISVRSLIFAVILCASQSELHAQLMQSDAIVSRTLLNSERIAERFGSYGIKVLERSERVRVSNLFSADGQQLTCRTFAIVFYPQVSRPVFAAEHRQILNGGSIGQIFADHGWRVKKVNRYFGAMQTTEQVAELMRDRSARSLAIHLYDFVVSRGDIEVVYATIAEVHHPDYLSLSQLRDIYGSADPPGPEAATALDQLLTMTRQKMN
jgi:hypothetical protein